MLPRKDNLEISWVGDALEPKHLHHSHLHQIPQHVLSVQSGSQKVKPMRSRPVPQFELELERTEIQTWSFGDGSEPTITIFGRINIH